MPYLPLIELGSNSYSLLLRRQTYELEMWTMDFMGCLNSGYVVKW
jgi:hypothetical protein